MATYTTKLGDQWDMIAKEVYGSELYADFLMEHNYSYLDVFQFDSGVVLNCPDLPVNATVDLPPWRS